MDPQVPWIVKTKACSSPRPSSSRRPASPSLRRPVLVALAIAWSRARPTCSAVVPASTRATSTPRVEIVFPVHGGLVAQSFQPQFALHVADKRMLEVWLTRFLRKDICVHRLYMMMQTLCPVPCVYALYSGVLLLNVVPTHGDSLHPASVPNLHPTVKTYHRYVHNLCSHKARERDIRYNR